MRRFGIQQNNVVTVGSALVLAATTVLLGDTESLAGVGSCQAIDVTSGSVAELGSTNSDRCREGR